MDGGTSIKKHNEWQNVLRATKDKTMWRSKIANILKGHGT